MPPAKLTPLRQRFERLLSGSAPADPLYLTNRTWVQKLKVAALIAVPVLILCAMLLAGTSNMFHVTRTAPVIQPLPDTKPAPDTSLTPVVKLAPTDLEVVNIHIARVENPPVVTGMLRNNTNQKVESAVVTFYLANGSGSLLATDSTSVRAVGAHGAVTFRAPLKNNDAEYVLLRDVRLN